MAYRGRHRRSPGVRRPSPRWTVQRALGIVALGLVLLLTTAGISLGVAPLPSPELPSATILYDVDGRPITRLFAQNRISVPHEAIPGELRQAIVAIEDFRFYSHKGIDPVSIARAAWVNLRAGEIVQGASTISQQLAENLYLSHDRRFSLKLQELFLTLKLESRYEKDEILDLYLNTIYLGDGTYGVEAAAQHYFGRARNLSLAQSAMLAGLARAPEAYKPTGDVRLAEDRRETVLRRMRELGMIADRELEAALAEPVLPPGREPQRPTRRAGYFVDYVLEQIREHRPDLLDGVNAAGYRIYTTLDLDMQAAAERAVEARLGAAGAADGTGNEPTQPQAALVGIDPANGEIRSLIGGRDYQSSPLNRAVKSGRRLGRQPGSAFKPFLYAAVFEQGYTVVDRRRSEPTRYPGVEKDPWPTNYGSRPFLWRDVTVREAVEISENVIAVKWAAAIGPDKVVEMARRLGINSDLGRDLSLVLGSYEVSPLELTAAYAPFANMGWKVQPTAIRRIEDRDGRVIARFDAQTEKVLDERVAFLLTDVLRGVIQRGTASNLAPILDGRPAAGKTGTTEHNHDAWFVGYTPALVAGVWVGNDRPSPLGGAGASLAGPIWADFVAAALQDRPPVDFPVPQGMVRLRVSALDGLLPAGNEPTISEWFIEGTEPDRISPLGESWFDPETSPWWDQIRGRRPSAPAPDSVPAPGAPGEAPGEGTRPPLPSGEEPLPGLPDELQPPARERGTGTPPAGGPDTGEGGPQPNVEPEESRAPPSLLDLFWGHFPFLGAPAR